MSWNEPSVFRCSEGRSGIRSISATMASMSIWFAVIANRQSCGLVDWETRDKSS